MKGNLCVIDEDNQIICLLTTPSYYLAHSTMRVTFMRSYSFIYTFELQPQSLAYQHVKAHTLWYKTVALFFNFFYLFFYGSYKEVFFHHGF